MTKEQGESEVGVYEIDYQEKGDSWIDDLTSVLGNPLGVQRLNESLDSDQEIAVFLAQLDEKPIVLTITRDVLSREPHFKLDVRPNDDKEDSKFEPYHSLISKIEIDERSKSVKFSPPSDEEKNSIILRGNVASEPLNLGRNPY